MAGEWNAFWYTPADPTLLGLLRVCTGLMLFYTHAVWGLALDDFFGPTSWLSPRLVRTIESGQYFLFILVVGAGPRDVAGLRASRCSCLLFSPSELWTRVTSVLALLAAISYVNRVPAALFGLDQINVMLTLVPGHRPERPGSLGRPLAGRIGWACAAPACEHPANLAQRLIQVHMCVIYLFAGISKLQGPSWWNGEAMWRAFANLEYQSLDMTWLAWHPWLINLMTLVSVVWEISFCVLIWRPLWRPLILAGALVLHIGIGACLGMWTFGLIMLVGCASFLPNDAVRQLAGGPSACTGGAPQRLEVSSVSQSSRRESGSPRRTLWETLPAAGGGSRARP